MHLVGGKNLTNLRTCCWNTNRSRTNLQPYNLSSLLLNNNYYLKHTSFNQLVESTFISSTPLTTTGLVLNKKFKPTNTSRSIRTATNLQQKNSFKYRHLMPAADVEMTTETPAAAGAETEKQKVFYDDDGKEISKNEFKKLQKKKENDAKKAAKEAEKAAKAAAAGPSAPKPKDDEELDPAHYRESRLKQIQKQMETPGAREAYPHKYPVTMSIREVVNKWGGEALEKMEKGAQLVEEKVVVAGRIKSKREQGKMLKFYEVRGDGATIQFLANKEFHEEEGGDFTEEHQKMKRGDIMGAHGFIGRSKSGELSIYVTKFMLLAPCVHMLPKDNRSEAQKKAQEPVLHDKEIRYRKRYLDLMLNDKSRKAFETRCKIISFLRRYFDERGFLEVETPMMGTIVGGATAKPFKTHHNCLNQDMFMRIAPELRLKELVVGGLDRVYEIGKNFRNEGIDLTHNPEFTACEFYMAYADYYDLLDMTEHMVSSMVKHVHGSYKCKFTPMPKKGKCSETGKEIEIVQETVELDFSPPWKRYSMVEEIEKATGTVIPKDFGETCKAHLEKLVQDVEKTLPADDNVLVEAPRTIARLLDGLVGHYIEDRMPGTKPFFIIEHPQIMSPLAKYHRSKPGLTERFELFIMGKELANAYTELNNPIVQRRCFDRQLEAGKEGDDEAQDYDEGFCQALEHGLPPTGGWGLGIDRMTMFLSNNWSIRDVILFPAMKPEQGGQKQGEGH